MSSGRPADKSGGHAVTPVWTASTKVPSASAGADAGLWRVTPPVRGES